VRNEPQIPGRVPLSEIIDYGKTIKAEPSEINDNTWGLELEDIEKDSSKVLQRLTLQIANPRVQKTAFKLMTYCMEKRWQCRPLRTCPPSRTKTNRHQIERTAGIGGL